MPPKKSISSMQKESIETLNKQPVIIVKNYNDLKTKLYQEKLIKIDKENLELKEKLNNIIGSNNEFKYEYIYGHFGKRNFALRQDKNTVDFIITKKKAYIIIHDFFSRKPQFTLIQSNIKEKASDILSKLLYFLENPDMDKTMIIAFSKSKIIEI
jgi:phosphate uptake regulator